MRARVKRWKEWPERFRCCEDGRLEVARMEFEGMLLKLVGPVTRRDWCCEYCGKLHERVRVRGMRAGGPANFIGWKVNLEVLDIEEGS